MESYTYCMAIWGDIPFEAGSISPTEWIDDIEAKNGIFPVLAPKELQ